MNTFYLLLLITVCYAREPLKDASDQNFQDECLSVSNEDRSIHHAPAFKWDKTVAKYAYDRCQLISQSSGLSHGHAGLKDYGENQFWGGYDKTTTTMFTCKQAITSWYNEKSSYDYTKPEFSTSTGHFTQLVWKSTLSVGCARCAGLGDTYYETYVVCNYSPAGNVNTAEQFTANVLPP